MPIRRNFGSLIKKVWRGRKRERERGQRVIRCDAVQFKVLEAVQVHAPEQARKTHWFVMPSMTLYRACHIHIQVQREDL